LFNIAQSSFSRKGESMKPLTRKAKRRLRRKEAESWRQETEKVLGQLFNCCFSLVLHRTPFLPPFLQFAIENGLFMETTFTIKEIKRWAGKLVPRLKYLVWQNKHRPDGKPPGFF